MGNSQGIVFRGTQTYTEIFKSALVCTFKALPELQYQPSRA